MAGLAPATALASQRALASAGIRAAAASVPGGTRLWAASYRDHIQGNSGDAVVASPDGSTVYVTGSSPNDRGSGHITTRPGQQRLPGGEPDRVGECVGDRVW